VEEVGSWGEVGSSEEESSWGEVDSSEVGLSGKVSLSGKVVLVLLAVEAGTVKKCSGFLPSRRVLRALQVGLVSLSVGRSVGWQYDAGVWSDSLQV